MYTVSRIWNDRHFSDGQKWPVLFGGGQFKVLPKIKREDGVVFTVIEEAFLVNK